LSLTQRQTTARGMGEEDTWAGLEYIEGVFDARWVGRKCGVKRRELRG
jgi:hypothetical protein